MRKFSPEEKRIIRRIREVIDEVSKKMEIKVEKVILFGSRVMRDYRKDSDWDLLVVVDGKDKKRRDEFWLKINRKLVDNRIKGDLIINNKKDVGEYAKYFGFIHYHALKEGVRI